MKTEDETEEDSVLLHILQVARNVTSNAVPKKSKDKYDLQYDRFNSWKKENKVLATNEDVLLAYFMEISQKYAPSSLWAFHSMLKMKILNQENIQIDQYYRLENYMRGNAKGFKSKKGKFFEPRDVEKFLNEADDTIHLLNKVRLTNELDINKYLKYIT